MPRRRSRLRGKPGDLQLTLKMIEMFQAKAKAAEEADSRRQERHDVDGSRRQLHRHDRLRRAVDARRRCSREPGITLAGCWAHVFRKFEEAQPDHPEAEHALAWIGALYEIDERAGDALGRRTELRRTEAAVVVAELKA